ncbi:MAG: T9SS type A sorting domain-containing protein [Saprospiraceae bacterium]|nr:T9SS type A sorting domain-containing protein [Saprospiraceae bacterium]
MKNSITIFLQPLPQIQNIHTSHLSLLGWDKLVAALLPILFSLVACITLPTPGKAQYQLFQKKVENAPYSHIYPASQGYVLTSSNGIALADNNLNFYWRRSFGSFASGTQLFPIGTRPASTGGFLVAGYGRQVSLAKFAPIMTETDASGNPVVSRVYAPFGLSVGVETTMQLAVPTADGGFITGGWLQNSGVNGPELYLLKLAASGVVQWSRGYRSNGTENLTDIRQLPDGSYIVAFTIDNEVALAKLDANGQSQWGLRYQTGKMNSASVSHDPSTGGYVVVCGAHSISNSLIFKTNSIGSVAWSKLYAPPTIASTVQFQTVHVRSDGYLIGGTFASSPTGSPHSQHAFMLKTDMAGIIQWVNLYAHAGNNRLVAVQPVPGAGAFFSGAFNTMATESILSRMDPNGYTASCAGATLFLLQNAGSVVVPASPPTNPLVSVAVTFAMSPAFALASQALPAPTENIYCQTTDLEEIPEKTLEAKAFPNPTADRTVLAVNVSNGGSGALQLFDLSGKMLSSKVMDFMAGEQSIEVDLTSYPPGCYILRAAVGSQMHIEKLVKQ